VLLCIAVKFDADGLKSLAHDAAFSAVGKKPGANELTSYR
jgi:hypothetical protein